MNGYLDKFLTRISLHLPKEALNTSRKIQFTSGTNFWNTLYTLMHTVFKTFYWGQLVEIRRLGLEERHEISQLSCQYL